MHVSRGCGGEFYIKLTKLRFKGCNIFKHLHVKEDSNNLHAQIVDEQLSNIKEFHFQVEFTLKQIENSVYS